MDIADTYGSITFIGNATTLIRLGELTLLTDPNFIHRHEQVDIGYGMHATRLTDPALEIEELPAVDAVLLSHFHGDHFDQVAERELPRDLPIVTNPEAAASLRERGFRDVRAIQPWENAVLARGDTRVRVTAVPGRHGPRGASLVLPDVIGELVELVGPASEEQAAERIYVTGDTLVIDELHELAARFDPIDVALLHLGATRVLGIKVTMDAADGLELMRLVRPRLAVPIHTDDYDVFTEGLDAFLAAARDAGMADLVHAVAPGESLTLRRLAGMKSS
jgi:L-ascorbate metabolism protein UlaG (beta-lactamase superfamily)